MVNKISVFPAKSCWGTEWHKLEFQGTYVCSLHIHMLKQDIRFGTTFLWICARTYVPEIEPKYDVVPGFGRLFVSEF